MPYRFVAFRLGMGLELGCVGTKARLYRAGLQCRIPRHQRRPLLVATQRQPIAVIIGLQHQLVFSPHKRRDKGTGWVVVNLLRAARLHHAPLMQDDDAIRHHHGFFAIVGYVNGRKAQTLLQGTNLVAQLQTNAGIQIGEGFIEQQDIAKRLNFDYII